MALGSWAVRLSGCDHIRIHFGKPSRHAFGSLRANSYSHRVRFDSLLTTSSRCLRACTLQAQAVPAARPEDVLAPRESPARVTPSVFAAARSACASWPSDLVSVRLLLALFVCSCRHDSVVELRLSVRITVSSSVSSWLARGVSIASGASRSRCCFSSFSVSPRGYHHGTRFNDDPRSFSCLSARHLIMAL